jgi:hypothetical protein
VPVWFWTEVTCPSLSLGQALMHGIFVHCVQRHAVGLAFDLIPNPIWDSLTVKISLGTQILTLCPNILGLIIIKIIMRGGNKSVPSHIIKVLPPSLKMRCFLGGGFSTSQTLPSGTNLPDLSECVCRPILSPLPMGSSGLLKPAPPVWQTCPDRLELQQRQQVSHYLYEVRKQEKK